MSWEWAAPVVALGGFLLLLIVVFPKLKGGA